MSWKYFIHAMQVCRIKTHSGLKIFPACLCYSSYMEMVQLTWCIIRCTDGQGTGLLRCTSVQPAASLLIHSFFTLSFCSLIVALGAFKDMGWTLQHSTEADIRDKDA
jgi:hypothetical protein